MTDTTKIVQALCYFLNKIKRTNKLNLVKLLFLADKYHLIRYGRTVTNDEYWAMTYGPVGTTTKDILTCDPDFLHKDEYEYIRKSLKKIGKHTFEMGIPCGTNRLSETDIEALDFILNNFERIQRRDFIKYVHKYPEWKQYEELFKQNKMRRAKIDTVELLSTIEDDCLAMPSDHIGQSKKILMGTYD